MDITAIVLSDEPVEIEIPGITVLGHVSEIRKATELYAARLAAIKRVQTEWFFCLDDDDTLPGNHLDLLGMCIATSTDLAYTNELLQLQDGTERIRKSAPYSRETHCRQPTLIHHLAVCRTYSALRAMRSIPASGCWGFEPMLYAQVAKEGGAEWLDEIGYIWRQRPGGGLSRHPSVAYAMLRSAQWINATGGTNG